MGRPSNSPNAGILTWVEFLEFSVEDALGAARVQAELRSAGERIPIPDVVIAGVARDRGASLVAAAAHFAAVAGSTSIATGSTDPATPTSGDHRSSTAGPACAR